ncbi:MAG: helix-turn-helix domain-containing protein [Waterburya sp.]
MNRPCTQKRLHFNSNDNEFKKLRKQARLSQEELAAQIGVAVSTIRRWEHGQAEPTMTREQMEKFCAAVKQPFIKLPKKLAN